MSSVASGNKDAFVGQHLPCACRKSLRFVYVTNHAAFFCTWKVSATGIGPRRGEVRQNKGLGILWRQSLSSEDASRSKHIRGRPSGC